MKNKHAQAMGRMKSVKKAKTSRQNGKLGGRPKRIATGIAYRKPRLFYGKYIGERYEYPIYTEAELSMIKKLGGEIKK